MKLMYLEGRIGGKASYIFVRKNVPLLKTSRFFPSNIVIPKLPPLKFVTITRQYLEAKDSALKFYVSDQNT